MWTLVDVIDQVIHDESFGCPLGSISVLPSFTSSNIYDPSPFPLDGGTHGEFLECIEVDLNVFVLYSLRTDYCMDVEV